MSDLSDALQDVVDAYPAEQSLFRFRSEESLAAVVYLQNLITGGANDAALRNTATYLLGKNAAPSGTPDTIRPLKVGGRLHRLLTNALQQLEQGAQRQSLIILLEGWDWIQLTNVHKYVAKHGNVSVATTTTAPAALAALGNNSKIYVVGHGGKDSFDPVANITPTLLADLIHANLPPNTPIKIQVDTCSSGLVNRVTGNSTAQTIKNRLLAKGRANGDISVSGTTGPSVTGVGGQRIVVDPAHVDTAMTIQNTLSHAYRDKINQATAAIAGLNVNSASDAIKQAASQAWGFTQNFFDDFEFLLNNWLVIGNVLIVIPHIAGAHKVTY